MGGGNIGMGAGMSTAEQDEPIRCPRCESDEITQGEIVIEPHPRQLWVGGEATKQVTIACTCRSCGTQFTEKRWTASSYDPE